MLKDIPQETAIDSRYVEKISPDTEDIINAPRDHKISAAAALNWLAVQRHLRASP
jgi:hypothetical protein